MLGFYNYTVILTYIGMLISFFGFGFAIRGSFQAALLCLMLSGLCDMFDGKIASTMKRTDDERHFGIQIDSLSDLICFGVYPALILRMRVPDSVVVTVIACAYALCALIRLAYFNVDELNRQNQTAERRHEYRGLPVTSSAIAVPLSFILGKLLGMTEIILPCIIALMAVAFISPFRLKKPGGKGAIVYGAIGVVELILVLGGFAG